MNSCGETDLEQVRLAFSSNLSKYFYTVEGASQIHCTLIYLAVIFIIILMWSLRRDSTNLSCTETEILY
jgi:hypothetical protein